MDALTVWQPYGWCIGAGFKLIENRGWAPSWKRLKEGDDFAIHGGAHIPSREDFFHVRTAVRSMGHEMPAPTAHEFSGTYGRGRIIAVVTFAGIVRRREDLPEAQRVWWVGPIGWVLSNVRQLQLFSAPTERGQQGLWPLSPGVEKMVRSQLAGAEGQLWRKTA
ncbi:MAG: ASCH domain-containing protein [Georgenia sp.]